MNRNPTREQPELLIERNPLLLFVFMALTAIWGYFTVILFRDMNPLGFLLAAPGVILAFQTLWFLLNPFASVYKDRFEIRHSLFSFRQWYFGDIHSVVEKEGKFYVVYDDRDAERVNLAGVRRSQRGRLTMHVRNEVRQSNARLAASA